MRVRISSWVTMGLPKMPSTSAIILPSSASGSRNGRSPPLVRTAHPHDTRPPRRCPLVPPLAELRRVAPVEFSDPQRSLVVSCDAPAFLLGRTNLPAATSARSGDCLGGPHP